MSVDIVFIGEVNDGKTTIVSCLVEDENAVISEEPGTTKIAHCHQLYNQQGETVLRAWDTPGFEETDDLHAWFSARREVTDYNLAERFIAEHADDPRWQQDVELLRPISEGALVVFVAASNRKPQVTDRKQLEVVRAIGADRIALINQKPGARDYTGDWNQILKREIGVVRRFSPLMAGIDDRLKLLDKLADCSEAHRTSIERARAELARDWGNRIEDLARSMLRAVMHAVCLRAVSMKGGEDAEKQLNEKVRRIERDFRERAKALFNHTKLEFESDFFQAEITSQAFWKVYGLGMTKWNAGIYGAITGGAMGAAVDLTVGGISLGVPTLVGGIGGGILAASAVHVPFVHRQLGGQAHEARLHNRSQVVNALTDRMIIFARCLLHVSHGQRPDRAIQLETGDRQGGGERLSFVQDWDGETIKAWARLVRGMSRSGMEMAHLENDFPADFQRVLERMRQDLTREDSGRDKPLKAI